MYSIKDTFETHPVYRGGTRGNSISWRNSSPAECIKLLLISPPYLILSSCSVNIRSSGFERSPTWKVTNIGYIYRVSLTSIVLRSSIFRKTKGVEKHANDFISQISSTWRRRDNATIPCARCNASEKLL